MVAMSRSVQGKRPRTGLSVGTPQATTISATLLIVVLLVASCGQSTMRAGKSAASRHHHADQRHFTGTIAFLDSW